MKIARVVLVGLLIALLPSLAYAVLTKSECIACHMKVTPGIVSQHLEGRMSKAGIDCSDCHGSDHNTADDWAKASMPTAETCAACHEERVEQYRAGKHNLAWFAMRSQAAWPNQPPSIVKQGYKGCSGCHKIGEKGLVGMSLGNPGAITRDGGKEISEYPYGNAQCDACHTRHSFKRAEAKDPRACATCHMGFDHPQWEMYSTSKHGVAWAVDGNKPDGRAPTCQRCHMVDGDHNVVTPWGFLGLRIPTKENVLALIEVAPQLEKQLRSLAAQLPSGHYNDLDDDPQWTLDRALILQAAGVLDENLQPTERFVEIVVQARAARGPAEFNAIRAKMKNVCKECHASRFVNQFFKAADDVVRQTDRQFAKAIKAIQDLYKDGILKKPAGRKYAPDLLHYYDAPTSIEQDLYLIFLEYKQRAFQGGFHVNYDYMHWYGWAPLKETVTRILEEAERLRAEHARK
jgi:hypothetical protein